MASIRLFPLVRRKLIIVSRNNSTYSFDHQVLQSIHKGGISRLSGSSNHSSIMEGTSTTENNVNYNFNHVIPTSRLKGSPFIIGVAGGTASGKTEVVKAILSSKQLTSVAVVPQDSFYKNLTEEEIVLAKIKLI